MTNALETTDGDQEHEENQHSNEDADGAEPAGQWAESDATRSAASKAEAYSAPDAICSAEPAGQWAESDATRSAASKAKAYSAPDAICSAPEFDAEKHEEEIRQKKEKIAELEVQLESILEDVSKNCEKKAEYFKRKAELKQRLEYCNGSIAQIEASGQKLMEQLDKLEENESRREMESPQERQKRLSEAACRKNETERLIGKIEAKMWSGNISLREEKELLNKIRWLREHSLSAQDMDREMAAKLEESITNQIEEQDEKLKSLKAQKKSIAAECRTLMDEQRKALDIQRLLEQRDAIQEEISQRNMELSELSRNFRNAKRRWENHQAELRRKQTIEKANELRSAQQAKGSVKDEALNVPEQEPIDEEVLEEVRAKLEKHGEEPPQKPYAELVKNTIIFCKALLPKTPDKPKNNQEVLYNNPEGSEILKRKDERPTTYWVPPTKKRAPSRNQKKRMAEDPERIASAPIKHTAKILKIFEHLRMEAPKCIEDVPAVLEKLEAKHAAYAEQIRKWESERHELLQIITKGASQLARRRKQQESKPRANLRSLNIRPLRASTEADGQEKTPTVSTRIEPQGDGEHIRETLETSD